MKNYKNIFVVLWILFLAFITSFCSGQYPFVSKINTKGFYYHFNNRPVYDATGSYMEFLFFYDDGTVAFFTGPAKTNEVNYAIKNIDMYPDNGRWGAYKITNDTIKAQILIHDPDRIGKISEEWAMIVSDSVTMYLYQTICDRCKNQYSQYGSGNKIIFQPMLPYRFMASLITPDSSKMRQYYKRRIQKKLYRQS